MYSDDKVVVFEGLWPITATTREAETHRRAPRVDAHLAISSGYGETKPHQIHDVKTVRVDILLRLIRRTHESGADQTVTFSEMLPDMDQLWLEDSAGERHTSELRLVIFDDLKPITYRDVGVGVVFELPEERVALFTPENVAANLCPELVGHLVANGRIHVDVLVTGTRHDEEPQLERLLK